MKIYKIIFVFILAGVSLISQAGEKGIITVRVTNIKSIKGELYVALYNSEGSFMNPEEASQKIIIPVTEAALSVTFENVDAGIYAISLFQDKNNNGILDTHPNGIPLERYGFSNNAKGKFGPPSFTEASFSVDGELTLTIKMIK